MRYCFLIVIFLAGFSLLSAQSAEEEVIRMKQGSAAEHPLRPEQVETGAEGEKKLKGDWDLMVGTSYTFMKGFGSGMQFYAAPMYTLPLNDRWSLHGGVLASSFTGLNMNSFEENAGFAGRTTSLSMFAAASYRMNDRLVLHGAGVKQLLNSTESPFTSHVADNFSFGATYRLSNNISIGASVRVTNGQRYYTSPFGSSSFASPVTSPFGW